MNNRYFKYHSFTLIEVIIALFILTGGILGAMALVSTSELRMNKTYEKFHNQHMLAQAAEYYLLSGSESEIDHGIFPYSGYSALCRINENASQEEFFPLSNPVTSNWMLSTYSISVIGPDGQTVSEVKVDKMVLNENAQSN